MKHADQSVQLGPTPIGQPVQLLVVAVKERELGNAKHRMESQARVVIRPIHWSLLKFVTRLHAQNGQLGHGQNARDHVVVARRKGKRLFTVSHCF